MCRKSRDLAGENIAKIAAICYIKNILKGGPDYGF